MPYTVYLLDLAKEDISNCARWITKNQDSTGILASYFLDAVEQTLERLKIAPKLFPIRHDDVRGISVKREGPKGEPQQFSHLIYYRLKNAYLNTRFKKRSKIMYKTFDRRLRLSLP